uniref:Uncharacterized protein n=1 Tax=Siphoviridae sp. ct5jB2 TaxID=2825337 RepID=A0A8S5TTX0_9CAUD|nr:MAG TPA: hypothetical protein [Siphoviridae sp. ct5jB2]
MINFKLFICNSSVLFLFYLYILHKIFVKVLYLW